MKTDWTPKNLTIAGSGVIAALLILPNLGKGWEALKYWVDSVPTAYAGKAQADAVRSDFDRYIDAQQEALKLEQQRNALQEEYNKKLMELQQQQAPNQAMNQRLPMINESVIWIESELVDGYQVCTDGVARWWWEAERGCE